MTERCPNCNRPIQNYFAHCPDCGHDLQVKCEVCGERNAPHHADPCICCGGDPAQAKEYRRWVEAGRPLPALVSKKARPPRGGQEHGYLRIRRANSGY